LVVWSSVGLWVGLGRVSGLVRWAGLGWINWIHGQLCSRYAVEGGGPLANVFSYVRVIFCIGDLA